MDIVRYKTLFEKFNVSKADLVMYEAKINSAKSFSDVEPVITHFNTRYVVPMSKEFTNLVTDTLTIALSLEVNSKTVKTNETIFIMASSAYQDTLRKNYIIIADMVGSKTADLFGATTTVKNNLIKHLIDSFDTRITGAMTTTQAEVLSYVRTLQREAIIKNHQLFLMNKEGAVNSLIEAEKALFKQNMLKKFPHLKNSLENGKVLRSRPWTDKEGRIRFRSYSLEDYTEMATSETLKNVT